MVNKAYRKGTQIPTKAMRIWASFVLSGDAHEYAKMLKERNPKWNVQVMEDHRPRFTNGRLDHGHPRHDY